MAGGHGYGDDDGELRSVAGGETEERGGGRSRERGRSERGSGTSPWRREGVGEAATAKQEVAGALRACATPRLCLLAEVEDDWHQARGLGCPLGQPGKGPGKTLFFLFLLCFIFFSFSAICF